MIRGVTASSRKRTLKRGFKQRNHHPWPGRARCGGGGGGGGQGPGGSAPGASPAQGMEGWMRGGMQRMEMGEIQGCHPILPGQQPSANKSEEDNWSKSGSLMFLCLKLKAQQHETT